MVSQSQVTTVSGSSLAIANALGRRVRVRRSSCAVGESNFRREKICMDLGLGSNVWGF